MTTKPLSPKDPLPSTRILLLGIWMHLSRRRRFQLGLLLVMMFGSGAAELLSLGAVLPFLAAISEPEQMWQQPIVQALANQVGFTQASQLLVPTTLIFSSAIVLAALVRLLNLWLNGRLAAAVGSDLSCEAYRRTLYQPYEEYVQMNSAAVITATTTHIANTITGLRSLLLISTSAVVAAALIMGLLFIDAAVAVGAAAIFGTAYGVLAINVSRHLRSNGQKITEASRQQIKALQEGLGAFRDVLLSGSQLTYLRIYRQADLLQRLLQAKNSFLTGFPRFILEAIGMVAIAILGGLLVLQRGSGAAVLPILGSLALGAHRLLPALQQVYGGWSTLQGCSAPMQSVLEILNQPLPPQASVAESLPPQASVAESLPLRESIRLEGVHFRYGAEKSEVLTGLDFQINRGERIGLIGSTGSGKSTTVDLLMGLLAPTAGQIFVDGFDLHDSKNPDRLLAWRAAIAHVPQTIYLADSSIAENIAFGVPRQQIDFARVREAAKRAQIAGFIEENPEGYGSYVGERGIRLSGGQRQRIGIARALYKQARVLVFDEATSALDTGTEEAVMEAVNGLSKDLTIVMIAHRLSTLQNCDRVIRLVGGLSVDYDLSSEV